MALLGIYNVSGGAKIGKVQVFQETAPNLVIIYSFHSLLSYTISNVNESLAIFGTNETISLYIL